MSAPAYAFHSMPSASSRVSKSRTKTVCYFLYVIYDSHSAHARDVTTKEHIKAIRESDSDTGFLIRPGILFDTMMATREREMADAPDGMYRFKHIYALDLSAKDISPSALAKGDVTADSKVVRDAIASRLDRGFKGGTWLKSEIDTPTDSSAH